MRLLPYLLILVFLTGCGSKSNMESFLREDVDMGYLNKIAVVPFENNTSDLYVSERVRDMVITQILSNGMFDVVDKGLVDSALSEEAIDLSKTSMDESLIRRIGQRMNVQAFLMGTIDSSEKIQRGSFSYPELSITLRLVDIHSGMILWQASGNKTGDSLSKRLFGLSNDDVFKVSIKLIRQLLSTLTDGNHFSVDSNAEPTEDVIPDEIGSDDDTEVIIVPDDQEQG